ncbi:MAG TPA: hypothetical protein VMI75_02835 [Polyangiaceae bacterium]|nr:hypothetical protein [Polyangiaceae bacterium]
MAKKARTRVAKQKKWETFLMQMAPTLAQMLSDVTAQNAKIEEKKVETQLKLAEAQCRLADSLASAITTLNIVALRQDAK